MHELIVRCFQQTASKFCLPFLYLLPLTLCSNAAALPAYLISSPRASTEFQNNPKDSLRVHAILASYQEHVLKDIALAEQHAMEALRLSKTLNYTIGLIESQRAMGEVHRINGNFAEAETFLRQAIALSENKGGEIEQAKNHLALYKLFFAQGNYAKAAESNQEALAIGERSSNPEILADAYANEGITFGINGQHIKAVEYFLKALELYKSLDDKMAIGLTLMRIGHTFELAGSYEKALDYLFQSLKISRELENWSGTGWCLLNIGVTQGRIYPDSNSLKLDYYQQALEMAERSGDFRLTLACLDNIGGTYSLAGDYETANSYLNKAYRLSRSAGHNSRTVFIAGNLAENYLYIGKLDSAVLFGEENLRIAMDENNTFEQRQALSVLSQVYAARRDNKKAYELLLRHTKLSDSIFNVQKSQQIEDLREKYETENKEKEIFLLTREKAAAEFRRNSFALLSVLLLVVGFLVFAVLKLRERKNALLLQKEIEVDRMKSRFFANISHEFRTPLTLILGPIDEMITDTENDRLKRYLIPMRRNAGRLLELVNQLLELSRVESGRLKPVLTKQEIVGLTKGIVMSFDSLAEMRNITLEVNGEREPLEFYVDRDKFEKILTNLLSNAFKFTPENGKIEVHIRSDSECRAPGGGPRCLEISVRDTGKGISQEDIAHIFDRFYQADNSPLLQQDGSGIGLALTKELVELHRGTIWATSDIESGAEIHFQLPTDLEISMRSCVDESAQPERGAVNSIDAPVHPLQAEESLLIANDASKPMVLLIEDHPDVRSYIRQILEESYNVIESSDGESGIARASERIPDLILSDVMMPKMNGHQVCSVLKREEKTSHIPIILLTAKADVESRIEGLESRADDYLTKPFVPKELLIRIQNLIESRQRLRDKYLRSMVLKPSEVAVNSVDEQFLRRLMDILEKHIGDEKFGVEALGVEIGMSRSQLHRKLKALIGQGPNQFIRTFRLNRAHDLLKANAATASEIAYSVGFSSPSYFTKCFHEQFGFTPSEAGDR